MELVCDFCKAKVSKVRRVALDEGYDRLFPSPPHKVLYACSLCSEEKEKKRLSNDPKDGGL